MEIKWNGMGTASGMEWNCKWYGDQVEWNGAQKWNVLVTKWAELTLNVECISTISPMVLRKPCFPLA